jgi:hypothetical protein
LINLNKKIFKTPNKCLMDAIYIKSIIDLFNYFLIKKSLTYFIKSLNKYGSNFFIIIFLGCISFVDIDGVVNHIEKKKDFFALLL